MQKSIPGLLFLITILGTAQAQQSPPMVSTLRGDGTLLVNGKPVLPYGFYISTRHTPEIRLKCVEEVHRIGGTVVHIQGPWDEDTRFLDRAAELGLWIIAGHTETEAKLERVKRFKNHPAIIAWTLYDDANTLSTIEHLTKMNRLVKEIVPNRLTFIPLGTQTREILMPKDGFFDCSDFVGWEMYPVANPKALDPTLKATETQMSLVAKAASGFNRPYWILPQSFKWPGSRVPNPMEYRNLCFVGLINGAKGVMPWSIYHMVDSPEVQAQKKAQGKPSWEEWYLPDSKDLWQECGVVAKELKALAPYFLNGKRTKLTEGGLITAALWELHGESLVVVANLSEKEPKEVSVPLPERIKGRMEPYFPNRPTGLTLEGQKLTGSIEPASVHIYRISAP